MKLSSCILLCLLSWTASGHAAEIVLTDGSRIVGVILGLEDAEDLRVDTEHMDVVTVDWDAVDSIRATAPLEVELFDGSRIYGPLVVSGDSVRAGFGDGRGIDRSQVFRIEEYNQTFQDAVELYTDLGMNLVRGNNVVTQVSTGAGFRYNGERFETRLDATAIVNEQTDGTDLRRTTLRSTYAWKLRDNWSLNGLYSYEADEQQGLDSRTLLGAAIGNRIINNRRLRLELFSGLALNTEDFDVSPKSDSLEGVLGTSVRWRSRYDVDVDGNLTVLPNLEQSGRTRAQLDGSISIDLWGDLDFKTTLYSRYDSDPPQGNSKNDYGTTVSLSWSTD